MAATDSRRVVLLAREGLACQRLHQALRDIGAGSVVVIDPLQADVPMLRAQSPEVLLVALELAIEDRLADLETVLADPSITVIFDDAELAATREGWDAQRWTRHLAAKVHGHGNVLPPGMEDDGAGVSLPRVPDLLVNVEHFAAVDTLTFEPSAEWELPSVDEMPSTPGGVETLVDGFLSEDISLEWEPSTSEFSASAVEPPDDESIGFVPVSSELVESDVVEAEFPTVFPILETEVESTETVEFSFGELSLVDDEAMFVAEQPRASTPPPVFDFSHLSLEDIEPVVTDEVEGAVVAEHGLAEEAASPDVASEQPADVAAGAVEALPVWQPQSHGFEVESLEDLLAPAALPPPLPPEFPPPAQATVLELVKGAATPNVGGSSEVSGALLLFAGIGGPDAVRKVLAELPARFNHPVLLYLRLDGGRYDNLVKQMERVSPMPVLLATPGQAASPSQVYVVPDDVSVAHGDDGQLHFGAGSIDVAALLLQMPARRTSALLLSGASPAYVEPALALSRAGAYVAGQSPQGAYDAAASRVLMAQGGIIGSPAELAAGVIEHSY